MDYTKLCCMCFANDGQNIKWSSDLERSGAMDETIQGKRVSFIQNEQ